MLLSFSFSFSFFVCVSQMDLAGPNFLEPEPERFNQIPRGIVEGLSARNPGKSLGFGAGRVH
jgi:hypothetical protein